VRDFKGSKVLAWRSLPVMETNTPNWHSNF